MDFYSIWQELHRSFPQCSARNIRHYCRLRTFQKTFSSSATVPHAVEMFRKERCDTPGKRMPALLGLQNVPRGTLAGFCTRFTGLHSTSSLLLKGQRR